MPRIPITILLWIGSILFLSAQSTLKMDTILIKPHHHQVQLEPYKVIWSQVVTEPNGKRRKT